ncbi:MAG: hypothetical protein RIR70_552 [Pseudomonadota bacterium]
MGGPNAETQLATFVRGERFGFPPDKGGLRGVSVFVGDSCKPLPGPPLVRGGRHLIKTLTPVRLTVTVIPAQAGI